MKQESVQPAPTVGHRNEGADVTAPDGSEIRLLVDQRHQATRASLCEVTLLAGQVSRPVWHQTVEEVWYVLEGLGQVWRCPPGAQAAKIEPVTVGPGDALTVPRGWRFQFRAGEDGPFRFLCYTSPPWPGHGEAQPAEYGGLGDPTV